MINDALRTRADVVLLDLTSQPEERLNAARDMLDCQPRHMIAIGPSDNAQLILGALQAGVGRYVDFHSLRSQLPIELNRLRDAPAVTSQAGVVFAVLGASGGCGASTIATNMAASLLASKPTRGRSLVMDLNLVGGDVAALLNLRPERTLADFCMHTAQADQTLFEKCITKHDSGLDVLAAPLDYRDLGKVTAKGVRKAISMARSNHEYVVLDVARDYSAVSTQALMQASVITLIMRLDFLSLRQSVRVLRYLNDIGLPSDIIRVVINATGNAGVRPADVERTLKLPIMCTIPEELKVVRESVNRGVAMVSDRPRSRISLALNGLTASLSGLAAQ